MLHYDWRKTQVWEVFFQDRIAAYIVLMLFLELTWMKTLKRQLFSFAENSRLSKKSRSFPSFFLSELNHFLAWENLKISEKCRLNSSWIFMKMILTAFFWLEVTVAFLSVFNDVYVKVPKMIVTFNEVWSLFFSFLLRMVISLFLQVNTRKNITGCQFPIRFLSVLIMHLMTFF